MSEGLDSYLEALKSEAMHTELAELFGTSEAKVRRDRRKIQAGGKIQAPLRETGESPAVRILTLDIESKPHVVYAWGLFKQFIGINQIKEPGRMMCFSAKWLGDGEEVFYSDFEHGRKKMLKAVHDLLSEADVVVTYNGDRYDLKRLNNEFYEMEMGAPKPYKSIDLFKQNKARFDFPSRKLDYLARVSGIGQKEDTGGFDLWLRCMEGNPEAWQQMEEYNRQDVNLTEALYLKMQPWLTGTTHLGVFTGEGFSCPYCGSEEMSWDGDYTHTYVQSYMLYSCDKCGGWARGTTSKGSKLVTRAVK